MECRVIEGAGVKLLFSRAVEVFTSEVESGIGDVGEIEEDVGSGRILSVESSVPN